MGKKMIHREEHLATFAIYKIAKTYMKIDLFGLSHLIYEGQERQIFLILFKEKQFHKKNLIKCFIINLNL